VQHVLSAIGIPLSVLAALAEKQWQAVPKEPTDAMRRAGEMDGHIFDSVMRPLPCFATSRWSEMLAAAPPEPEGE
jgi:hypothetical protein